MLPNPIINPAENKPENLNFEGRKEQSFAAQTGMELGTSESPEQVAVEVDQSPEVTTAENIPDSAVPLEVSKTETPATEALSPQTELAPSAEPKAEAVVKDALTGDLPKQNISDLMDSILDASNTSEQKD